MTAYRLLRTCGYVPAGHGLCRHCGRCSGDSACGARRNRPSRRAIGQGCLAVRHEQEIPHSRVYVKQRQIGSTEMPRPCLSARRLPIAGRLGVQSYFVLSASEQVGESEYTSSRARSSQAYDGSTGRRLSTKKETIRTSARARAGETVSRSSSAALQCVRTWLRDLYLPLRVNLLPGASGVQIASAEKRSSAIRKPSNR